MKRDMELMRKILFKIEEEYKAGEGSIYNLKVENYEMSVLAEHCDLLYQEGLISDYKSIYANGGIYSLGVSNLSNIGYDYLELIRNEDIWLQTNEEVKKKKLPQTIETIGTIAASIVGTFMREYNR